MRCLTVCSPIVPAALAIAIAAALVAGCAKSPAAYRHRQWYDAESFGVEPPAWFHALPEQAGYIYAMGVNGRSLYKHDALKNARDKAVEQIARSLDLRIRSVLYIEEREGSRDDAPIIDQAVDYQVSDWTRELAEQADYPDGGQQRWFWCDPTGRHSRGVEGSCYAVLRLAVPSRAIYSRSAGTLRDLVGRKGSAHRQIRMVKACCQSEWRTEDGPPPPGWFCSEQTDAGDRLRSVGVSGRTLFQEDGKKYAADDARKRLVIGHKAVIQSYFFSRESTRGTSIGQATMQDLEGYLSQSRVEDYWVDITGRCSGGEKETTYALASVAKRGR